MEEGSIPLTFILVAVLYIGEQIYQGVFIDDDVSNFTHILGGVCGAVLGYYLNKGKLRKSGSGDNTVNTMSVTNGNSMYY